MPKDSFALLGQPRRPWLDPESLKAAFHRLAAERHPDRTGDSRAFAEIIAAYGRLHEPAARLRHLLELETPEVLASTSPVPANLAEAFMQIATLRRTTDAFVKQQEGANTPLAQALLASEKFTLQRDVRAQVAELEAAGARIEAAIQEVDASWARQKEALAPRLYLLQQELVYVQKWSAQLREALFALQGLD